MLVSAAAIACNTYYKYFFVFVYIINNWSCVRHIICYLLFGRYRWINIIIVFNCITIPHCHTSGIAARAHIGNILDMYTKLWPIHTGWKQRKNAYHSLIIIVRMYFNIGPVRVRRRITIFRELFRFHASPMRDRRVREIAKHTLALNTLAPRARRVVIGGTSLLGSSCT